VEDPASWKRERRSRTTTNKPFCNGNQNSNSKRIFTRYSGLSLRAWSIAHFSERRLSTSSQPSPETQPPEPIHSVSTIPAPPPHITPALPGRSLPALPSLPLRAPMKAMMVCAMDSTFGTCAATHRNGSSAHPTQPVTFPAHAHSTDYATMSTTQEKYAPASNTDVERAVRLPSCPPPTSIHFFTSPPCPFADLHTHASLCSRLSVVISTVTCALKLCAYYALPR
jgi:hypothetical protein